MPAGRALSILWPAGGAHNTGSRLSDDVVADLQLHELVAAIVSSDAVAGRVAAREQFARSVLTELLADSDVIEYRQAVLTDLLDDPALRARLEAVLPALEELGTVPRGERYRPTSPPDLERVARRLADLELLVAAIVQLTDALRDVEVKSAALSALRGELDDMRRAPEFASLERELPRLRATFAQVRSVTIGVNLGPDLAPRSATVLELGSEPIDGRRGLLSRLLGGAAGAAGLTPLQRGERAPLGRPNELVRDLQDLLGEVVAPVQEALERYARVSTDALRQLGSELAFMLGAARLFERLRAAGLPVCRPQALAAEERCTELTGAYDVGLALRMLPDAQRVVTNAVCFAGQVARVWVLTGPNRGGKTTYIRAVGLAQVLFQVGLYVPASSARMSPADVIFTHFPGREELRPGLGRLDLDAERLAAIFHHATPRSLILLNEALSGTSALEALDLARGLVRGLRLLGARAIYVTHLHELASSVDEINASTPGDGTVRSLLADSVESGAVEGKAVEGGAVDSGTAGRDPVRRTYRIVPRAPRGVSFAAEIAEAHGISYEQLARLLRERNLT